MIFVERFLYICLKFGFYCDFYLWIRDKIVIDNKLLEKFIWVFVLYLKINEKDR